jgi:hypothetical protein
MISCSFCKPPKQFWESCLYYSALLEQSKKAETAKLSFEKILQALLSLLKNKWATIEYVIVTLQQTRQEVKELATEPATINFSQLVGATSLAEMMQKALRLHCSQERCQGPCKSSMRNSVIAGNSARCRSGSSILRA